MDTLDSVALDKDNLVRDSVASNINILPPTLAVLGKDGVTDIRFLVCSNPNTSLKTLVLLQKDKSKKIRIWAERNYRSKLLKDIAL